jgi:hypothetical protein
MHKHLRKLSLIMSLTAVTAAIGNPAHAQAAKPVTAATAAAPYLIQGFRSAHFGMSEAQVREAIARDFQPAAGEIKEFDNDVEKTRLLALALSKLEPGPGAASVSYIFGASSHQLVHVNVVWTSSAQPQDAERGKFAAAAAQLSAYFRALNWQADRVTGGVPAGANGLVMFAGMDANNGAVEVRLNGVATTGADGKPGPAPTGPTQLRLAYMANLGQPDIAPPLKKNDF